MSKRCKLQKEYHKEFGNYKGDGKYSDQYVKWLEEKLISQSFNNQREMLIDFSEKWNQFYCVTEINIGVINEYLKGNL